MSFNDRLKQRRKEKKLTQKEIAPLLGIKQNTYSDWETGKSEPNLENVVKLSKILGTTTDELLGQTIYPKVDLLRFLDDFDVSNIKDFTKSDVDKLKFAIMFEMTRNKVNALNLKDDLILKYKLDKDEREILNTVFSEVQDEMMDLLRH
ncbi:helix-turn-helix domain-containing protein [Streptococcus parauberis]|uniref:helix-turn-helix domain-containing protein n=1 Tax=Streptococcus parauberis TaxID=1348 RepID=UPI000C1CB63E|nr:helix-turn-helix domain-containing protein [Streptococcus parauberis]PIO77982.1 HTH-type transcriptional regulator ImmR [Streptococcus parauberis]POS66377.1 HTH-type transcriptional regulator ImmR [Streptococcus parauberis]